jgi:hypothetical protein
MEFRANPALVTRLRSGMNCVRSIFVWLLGASIYLALLFLLRIVLPPIRIVSMALHLT